MKHRECGPGETYVGNTHLADEWLAEMFAAGISTARFGKVAYDWEGNVLPSRYRSCFVAKSQMHIFDQLVRGAVKQLRRKVSHRNGVK